MSNIGDFLKELRGNRSLRKVEELSGVSHTYLSSLEKGADPRTGKERNPTPETLRKLAKVYDYPYLKLLEKAGYMTKEEVENQEEMIQETHSQLDEMFKERGAYLTPENKEILDKEKLIDKYGHIPQGELQKLKEISETKNEKPAIFAGDDILFNIKSNPNVSLNFKPLKQEDKKRMEDLLKKEFPEYFQ